MSTINTNVEYQKSQRDNSLTKSLIRDFAILVVLLIFTALFYITYIQDQDSLETHSIKKVSSYEELEGLVNEASSGGYRLYARDDVFETGTTSELSISGNSEGISTPPGAASKDYSKTNIQVEGVDEADIVKTDGEYIYAVSGNTVSLVNAYPAQNAKIDSTIIYNGTIYEIFVNDEKLVLFGQKSEAVSVSKSVPIRESSEKTGMVPPSIRYSPKATISIYDISDKSSPLLSNEVSIDGNYYDSRMIGQYIYIIANNPVYYRAGEKIHVPEILLNGKCFGSRCVSANIPEIYYFEDMPGNVFTTVAAINLENTNDISSKILLTNYAQNMYVSEKSIYITYSKWMSDVDYLDKMVEIIVALVPSNIQGEINAVMKMNLSKNTKMQAVEEIMENYVSTLNEEEKKSLEEDAREKMEELEAQIAKEREKTIVQKISIERGNINYETNGEVPGNTLNQFSMDEHKGYFRIATTTRGRGSSSSLNHVYVLNDELNSVGKLEDLASGERIYSVRFMGDKAYMVTFRQIDPLFVIDLSVPQNPEVLGFLKIPGVSDYLHPYDENHIIGVGRDATEQGMIQGMKLSLFDVSDVKNPKEISKYMIGERGTNSEALRDHKAFLFDREKKLLVIPVQVSEGRVWNAFQGAYVFNIDLDTGIAFKGKITHENRTDSEKEKYYYDYSSQIRRSLYIENVLYTISQRMIKMNALHTLDEVNKIDLPYSNTLLKYYGIAEQLE